MKLWFLSAALFALPLQAHDMRQVKAVMRIDPYDWSASIDVEAWSIFPEDAEHSPNASKAGEFAGREWAKTLDQNDITVMRQVAQSFLRDCFQLSLQGRNLDFDIAIPTLDDPEPSWAFSAQGQAMAKIKLTGKWPPGDKGELMLLWNDYYEEPMSMQVTTRNPSGEEQLSVLQVEVHEPIKLANVEAGQEVRKVEDTSLLGWIILGFEHIIPKGLDHICFILGLFLLQPNLRALLWQSTAFTIAHSITLGMVLAGLFAVPASIVEPAIALSIAYIGFENLWIKELKPWRIALVFCLGLLHGMGFASVMQDLDIPKGSIFKPLLGFNLGVECGQLTVLIVAFLATWTFLKRLSFRWIRLAGSLLIGLTGLYWTVERIAG
jgi:hydrogenase/urease accessory protein HupE